MPVCEADPVPPPVRRLGALPPTLYWEGGLDGILHVLDQTLLPGRVEMRACRVTGDVWECIRSLRVRGAPAIGVAAAYGVYLGVRAAVDGARPEFLETLRRTAEYLCSARPTAVNLPWAVQRVRAAAGADTASASAQEMARCILREAHAIAAEDVEVCAKIGQAGAGLVPEGGGVLTHCNAGALATVGEGTALAVLYEAWRAGRRFRVLADETRPLLQGARLTAYELAAAGLDVTVICDSAAAQAMARGQVQMVVVGADRIAANGDTANKIGTYGLALAAAAHGLPFYVAAPRSTFDLRIATGAEIPIEERGEDEVRRCGSVLMVPARAKCVNPAFDVTPARLISGIVTECGVLKPVTAAEIQTIFA